MNLKNTLLYNCEFDSYVQLFVSFSLIIMYQNFKFIHYYLCFPFYYVNVLNLICVFIFFIIYFILAESINYFTIRTLILIFQSVLI